MFHPHTLFYIIQRQVCAIRCWARIPPWLLVYSLSIVTLPSYMNPAAKAFATRSSTSYCLGAGFVESVCAGTLRYVFVAYIFYKYKCLGVARMAERAATHEARAMYTIYLRNKRRQYYKRKEWHIAQFVWRIAIVCRHRRWATHHTHTHTHEIPVNKNLISCHFTRIIRHVWRHARCASSCAFRIRMCILCVPHPGDDSTTARGQNTIHSARTTKTNSRKVRCRLANGIFPVIFSYQWHICRAYLRALRWRRLVVWCCGGKKKSWRPTHEMKVENNRHAMEVDEECVGRAFFMQPQMGLRVRKRLEANARDSEICQD